MNAALMLAMVIGNEARLTEDHIMEINEEKDRELSEYEIAWQRLKTAEYNEPPVALSSDAGDEYQAFLETKAPRVEVVGFEPGPINSILFDWQAEIVRWNIRKGRSANFQDCGLGKTIQSVEWIRQMAPRCGLIVAPLGVTRQTIKEAKDKLGIEIRYCSEPQHADGLWITNYDRLHNFVAAIPEYEAIALDESSILKSLDGVTRTLLLTEFTAIKYRSCWTATPAPNDLTELCNHAEFLGVMTRKEMLATFFVHDSAESGDKGWRLKKHAQDDFWRWVAQWAVYIRKPSDLGYPDGDFVLPPLNIEQVTLDSEFVLDGFLFPSLAKGITGRTSARKATVDDRVDEAVRIITQSDEPWIVWHGRNDEGENLKKALGNHAVLIEVKTKDDDRVDLMESWRDGKAQTLITKAGMFGWGLNFQHCHNVMYLGLDDSFEKWYQSIRRCWRFGQNSPVRVVVVTTDAESAIVDNVKRKERNAADMAAGIVAAMKDSQIESLHGKVSRRDVYKMKTIEADNYKLMMGDCMDRIKEIPSHSVGLTVSSIPFGGKLYTYSPSDRDLGNCKDQPTFFEQFAFLIPELLRVTKPGRRCCIHVQQLATTMVNDGVIGMYDFRADVVRAFVAAGWIYDGEVVIDKDPQAQAIRTKAKSLMFVQKNKDSASSRPAMADYILPFRAPGENKEPIKTDVSNEEWIEYARPIWYNIKESDTLSYQSARDNADERHICALQLETIRRCIRLWSNRGDVVLDTFGGIGSTGYVALEQDRKAVMCELKESYFTQMEKNMAAAIKQDSLFGMVSA